jgi:hypothetical protein
LISKIEKTGSRDRGWDGRMQEYSVGKLEDLPDGKGIAVQAVGLAAELDLDPVSGTGGDPSLDDYGVGD